MYVCICWFDLFLQGQPNSLKGKRQVLKSLKDRIWNKFRVSVAEVGKNNLWQRIELGISFVSNDKTLAEKMFSDIQNSIYAESDLEIVDQFYEIEKVK